MGNWKYYPSGEQKVSTRLQITLRSSWTWCREIW